MKIKIFLATLLIFSAVLRVSFGNHPFWVDEFSSAIQARLIQTYDLVGFFNQQDYYAEPNNVLPHILIALSFSFFGEHEWTARLPFMIIGSLVPLMVFLLGKALFDTRTGIISSLLTATSYFMITWSRQARGYPLQQFLLLGLLYSYVKYRQTQQLKYIIIFTLTSILGIFTHYFFGLFVAILVISLALQHREVIKKHIFTFISLSAVVFIVAIFANIPQNAVSSITTILYQEHPNNLWYYHSLLWREETIITLFSVLGVGFILGKRVKYTWPFFISIGLQLFALVFFLPAYTSRYLLPIFPLLILCAGFFIVQLSELVAKELKLKAAAFIMALAVTLFIIANGYMFTLKPQPFYSVDHVMRDIALVDYHAVYTKITTAQAKYPELAVIETWADRARWYLGQEYPHLYWFRWLSVDGTINGLPLSTNATKDKNGTTIVALSGPRKIPLISSLAELETVIATHPQGFIWIDDTSMPADVIAYAKAHFVTELELSHYQFDDNPYSIWPGTLYSWGIEQDSATPAQP